ARLMLTAWWKAAARWARSCSTRRWARQVSPWTMRTSVCPSAAIALVGSPIVQAASLRDERILVQKNAHCQSARLRSVSIAASRRLGIVFWCFHIGRAVRRHLVGLTALGL